MVASISHLTTVHSLSILTRLHPDMYSPRKLRPTATCLSRLSALTALTHLELDLSLCYEHDVKAGTSNTKTATTAWPGARCGRLSALLSALGTRLHAAAATPALPNAAA